MVVFGAIYLAALRTPPLLDDADASHAQAAAHMAESGDWVTLQVNGVRYLEKPPLPYWIVAGLYKVLGENAFATHLPGALAVLGCAWLDLKAGGPERWRRWWLASAGCRRLAPRCAKWLRPRILRRSISPAI